MVTFLTFAQSRELYDQQQHRQVPTFRVYSPKQVLLTVTKTTKHQQPDSEEITRYKVTTRNSVFI